MKVLNLYAGLGGNRKLWKEVKVTAIENNKSVAAIYKDFFPNDKIIVCDAHNYLLQHFQEFDFIWSSSPCPTHSRLKLMAVRNGSQKAVYPNMKLYEEIIFLKYFFSGKWVVENVKSYYKPLIKPKPIDRHYFWSNFVIPNTKFRYFGDIKKGHWKELQEVKGVNIEGYKIEGRRKDAILRSYVNPELGLHIFNAAFKDKQMTLGGPQ